MSAILASPYSLNPTTSPHSALDLLVPIPPPTQESRQLVQVEAGKLLEQAKARVQNARQAQHQTFRKLTLAKVARPDDVKRAETKMEDTVKKGIKEVERLVDAAKEALKS